MYSQRSIAGLRARVQALEQIVKECKQPPAPKQPVIKNTLPLDELEQLIGETMTLFNDS